MKLYKLTEQNYTTYNNSMTWKIGKTNKIKKCKNPELCSSSVIHAYRNKNLALLLNPIHANIKNPILLECSGEIAVEDYGKCGVFSLTPKKEIKYPQWYRGDKKIDVIIMFSILCAESVLPIYESCNKNDDRIRKAIEAAKGYLTIGNSDAACAAYAADAAAYAVRSAANAARSAAYAARSAANAAYAVRSAANAADAAARAAYAVRSAAYAADATAYAAYAADAADAAAYAADAHDINFCKLADKAVEIIMSPLKAIKSTNKD